MLNARTSLNNTVHWATQFHWGLATDSLPACIQLGQAYRAAQGLTNLFLFPKLRAQLWVAPRCSVPGISPSCPTGIKSGTWALVYLVSSHKHLPATGKSHSPAGSTIITEEWQEGLVVSCSSSGNERVVFSLWLEIKLKPKGQPIYRRVVKRCQQLHFDCCHDLTLLFLLSAAELWVRTGSLGHWAARTRLSLHLKSP